MKAHKIYSVFLIIFFILAISIPLVAINKTPGKISTTENRVLASFPKFSNDAGKLNKQFIKDFDSWFNDNLGFRDELVKANTMIQYDLFGKLTKKDTIIGKDNWLYYATPEIIKDYQQLNLPSKKQLEDWGNSLEQIDSYLEKKNIPLIVMLNLDKKTIYPENYPNSILKVGNTSRTELISDYFTNKTNLDFFTPKIPLLQAKNKATVYSPRYDNGHWNSYGAFIGYTELMNKVRNYFPDIKVLSWDDFIINEYQRSEKIYNAITFTESDYSFDYKHQRNATQTYGVLDNFNLKTSTMSATYKNSYESNAPKVLILGDSYLYGFLTPNMAESFSEMTFIYTDNIDRIKFFVDSFKPDIVIYENVERSFENTMQILSASTEFIEYNTYADLPVINNHPQLWLDYIDNEIVKEQDSVTIQKSSGLVNLSGWALDSRIHDVAGNVFLKVGNEFYSGSYGITRNSVSDYFNDPNLRNSGFQFNISVEELISAGKFSFVIISKDKTYQYAPIEYKVVVN